MRAIVLAALVALGCGQKARVFPTCGDNVKNGAETDVDCGGGLCTPCNAGKSCAVDKDCRDKICGAGSCVAASCSDGIKNGSESDVDCGGPDCMPCGDGRICAGGNDCQSRVCNGAACQAPSCSDGFQNGDEVGIDCGGACAPCDAAVNVPHDLSSTD
jgi:hypothetical protein